MIDEEAEEELQKQTCIALTSSIALSIPAPVVVIYEPWGPSNLITKGSKTSKD